MRVLLRLQGKAEQSRAPRGGNCLPTRNLSLLSHVKNKLLHIQSVVTATSLLLVAPGFTDPFTHVLIQPTLRTCGPQASWGEGHGVSSALPGLSVGERPS